MYVFLNLLNVLAISILGIFSPLFLRFVFDEVFPSKNMSLLLIVVGIGCLFELLRTLLSYLKDFVDLHVAQKIQFDLRKFLFNKFENLHLENYSKLSIGDHLWRLTNDIVKVQEMVSVNISRLLQTLLELLFFSIVAFSIDWKLCLITLSMLPIILIVGLTVFKKTANFYKSNQELDAALNSFLKENVSGIEEIKANNLQKSESRRHLKKLSAKIRVDIKGNLFYYFINLFDQSVIAVWGWIITLVGGYHVIVGTMTVGDFIAVQAYLYRILGPLYALNGIYQTATWQLISAGRVLEYLNSMNEEDEKLSTFFEFKKKPGVIEFKNVSFKYSENSPEVIRGLDLEMECGTKVAIVGPVGCGKSTIVKLLLRFYRPVSGSITFNKTNIAQINPKDLRNKISVVRQNPVIFNETIMNNIKNGNNSATDQGVVDILKKMDVYDYFNELKSGLNTVAGEDGSNLSNGQKQLIAIARAYIKDPDILILDEATSSLDAFTEMKVNVATRKIMEGRTTIMIAHRLNSINNVDKIFYMQDGKIAESGTLKELLARRGYYYKLHIQYFGLPAAQTAVQNEEIFPPNEVTGEYQPLFDLQKENALSQFSGKVGITSKYGETGELEVDLTGYSGYCQRVCSCVLDEQYTGKKLRGVGVSIYVPGGTTKDNGFFSVHFSVITKGFAWQEMSWRPIKAGWNNLILTDEKGGGVDEVNQLIFDFNSDGVILGPVYISEIKGNFSDG